MKQFPHKQTPQEYAAEKEVEEHERHKAIAMGDNEEVESVPD